MEHKLILGGEQYLPFARGRIKALRATGLSHAGQQFEIDGISVKVRVAGEHEYIQLEGGKITIAMDSGIVNLFGVNPGTSDSYRPGELYATSYRGAYDASFVADPASTAGERIKVGEGAIDGELTVSSTISGRIGPDASVAESFAPNWVLDNSTVPPGKMRNPTSETLETKKRTVATVPASIFTGKCRLYVQAMYGRHLYDKSGTISGPPSAPESGLSTPWLLVPSYRRAGSTPHEASVAVTTNTGVFWDRINARHWMLRVGYGELSIYPLAVPNRIAPLRQKLKQERLSQEDREHLEAYILGYSLPDSDRMQIVVLDEAIPTYSMGYGWHWNYSGTEAEIVVNSKFEYSPGGTVGMRSSRYRISTSLGDDGVWGAVLTAPERDVVWSLDRDHWTVIEPSWAPDGKALKVTSGRFNLDLLPGRACDAPFYVFYDRDELNVCRVGINHGTDAAERVSTPYYAGGSPFGYVDAYTVGYAGGRVDDRAEQSQYNATFSIGAYSTPGLPLSTSRAWHMTNSSPKKPSGVYTVGLGSVTGTNISVETGTFPDLTTVYLGGGTKTTHQSEQLGYTITDVTGTESSSSFLAAIVPKYDSEAVYVRGRRFSSRSGTGSKYIVVDQGGNNGNWSRKETFTAGVSGLSVDYLSYSIDVDWPGGNSTFTTTGATESQESTDWDTSVLLCRNGTVPTPIDNLNQLFSIGPDDLVNEYSVQCGVRPGTAVVQWLEPKQITTGDLPEVSVPAFVGWI